MEEKRFSLADLKTYATNTWCPGCGDFGIEVSAKQTLAELINEGVLSPENIVVLSGVGCHAKISDYFNTNSFYALHGRAFGPAMGIKLANPELTVVVFAGDGDAYGEGIEHLIFAAKRNSDINAIVHDNRVYGLTTGQFTPTSPVGFKGKSTPKGSVEHPLNPIELMLVSGATFVARGFSGNVPHLKKLIKEAVKHRGFSFIDVLQPCVTYFNTFDFYRGKVYDLQEEKHDESNWWEAMKKAREWDYSDGDAKRIPIGIFYRVEKPTFEDEIIGGRRLCEIPAPDFDKVLEAHI